MRNLTVTTSGGRELVLVDHVAFDVRRGQALGLVGETGAGKSVIAQVLLQVGGNRIASGSIVFDGIQLVNSDLRRLGRCGANASRTWARTRCQRLILSSGSRAS